MLAAHFLRRGYPLEILDKAYNRCQEFSREMLLNLEADPSLHTNNSEPTSNQAFSITTYSPMGNPNKNIIQDHWDILGTSATTQNLYELRIVHGHRHPPNLRDSLVHAKLKLKSKSTAGTSGREIVSCTNSKCRYCPLMNHTGRITSTVGSA